MFMETPITKICCGPKSATVVKPSKMQKKKKNGGFAIPIHRGQSHTKENRRKKKKKMAKQPIFQFFDHLRWTEPMVTCEGEKKNNK